MSQGKLTSGETIWSIGIIFFFLSFLNCTFICPSASDMVLFINHICCLNCSFYNILLHYYSSITASFISSIHVQWLRIWNLGVVGLPVVSTMVEGYSQNHLFLLNYYEFIPVTMITHWFQFIDMLHVSLSSTVYVLPKAHFIHHRTLGANVQNHLVPVLYNQNVFTIFITTHGFIYFTSFVLFYRE